MIGGRREVVVHELGVRGPVPLGAQAPSLGEPLGLVGHDLVPLEEHVLVQMRQPVVLRGLCH